MFTENKQSKIQAKIAGKQNKLNCQQGIMFITLKNMSI